MRMIFNVIIVLGFISVALFMISPWFKKIGGAVKDAHDDLKENLSDDEDDVEDEHDKYASSERAIAPHTRSQHSFTSSTRTTAQQEEIDHKAREEHHARLTREWAEQAKQRLEKQRLEEARKRRQREEKERENMNNGYPYVGNPTWGAYVSDDDSSRHHSHSSHHDSSSSYDSGSSSSSDYDSSSSSYDSGSSSSYDSGSSDSGSW